MQAAVLALLLAGAPAFAQHSEVRMLVQSSPLAGFRYYDAKQVWDDMQVGDALTLGGDELAVDGVLLDIGVSSPQLDSADRGFSFRRDGPLDMRMDRTRGITAAEWLAGASEAELREVLDRYGEERFAKQIAKAIVVARQGRTLTRTRELATIVGEAVRTREPGQDPATRTFQALRIHINQELEELRLVLPQCVSVLKPGGRLAVVSFHSLEDRIVKEFFREQSKDLVNPPYERIYEEERKATLKEVNRKPITPSEEETKDNPRARSAKLRIAEKI